MTGTQRRTGGAGGERRGRDDRRGQAAEKSNYIERVEEGAAESVALLRRFGEIGARRGELEPDEMEAAPAGYAEQQDTIDRLDLWDLERKLDVTNRRAAVRRATELDLLP